MSTKKTSSSKRHYGARPSMRTFDDEQIKEMETMRYKKRMSFADIGVIFHTSAQVIEKQLCRNGNHYADDRPLRAKPFDGWDFEFQNLPL